MTSVKLTDLVGAVSPPAAGAMTAATSAPSALKEQMITHRVVPGAVGAAAGAYLYRRHRVLGGLFGLAVGDNAYRLYRGSGDDRKGALADIGVAAAGVYAARRWKRRPVIGFVAGALVGSVLASFVPGSTAYTIRHR